MKKRQADNLFRKTLLIQLIMLMVAVFMQFGVEASDIELILSKINSNLKKYKVQKIEVLKQFWAVDEENFDNFEKVPLLVGDTLLVISVDYHILAKRETDEKRVYIAKKDIDNLIIVHPRKALVTDDINTNRLSKTIKLIKHKIQLIPKKVREEDSMNGRELEREQERSILVRRVIILSQWANKSGLIGMIAVECITIPTVFNILWKYLMLEDFVGLYTTNKSIYNFILTKHVVFSTGKNMERVYCCSPVPNVFELPPKWETWLIKTIETLSEVQEKYNQRQLENQEPEVTLKDFYQEQVNSKCILIMDEYRHEVVYTLWCKMLYEIDLQQFRVTFPFHFEKSSYRDPLFEPIIITQTMIPGWLVNKNTLEIYHFNRFDLHLPELPNDIDEIDTDLNLRNGFSLNVFVLYKNEQNDYCKDITLGFIYNASDKKYKLHYSSTPDGFDKLFKKFEFFHTY